MDMIKYIRKTKNCSGLIFGLFPQGNRAVFFIAGLLLVTPVSSASPFLLKGENENIIIN